jgi:hypothetical protein
MKTVAGRTIISFSNLKYLKSEILMIYSGLLGWEDLHANYMQIKRGYND